MHTPDAKALVELQRRDTAIDALAAAAAAVPVKLKALETAFEAKKRSMSEARDALLALQAKKKDVELRLAEAEEGIRKHQRELNMVKDNAAFKALLTEIEHDKQAKDDLETQELVLLEEIDRASVLDRQVQEEVKKIEASKNAEAAALGAETARLAAAIEEGKRERSAAAAALGADLLEKYEAIRSSRKGLAVAPAHEDSSGKFSCGGCNMTLTPQKMMDVKKPDTFAVCADCRRLLYLESTLFG